ncbi:MAG: hypothetical protein RQ745_06825 [Longimicrobiales bacterium]|nr:hypothetical protein [Longimicrobiales bacterium]
MKDRAVVSFEGFTTCRRWSSLAAPTALLLAVTLWPSTAAAQADPDSVRHRNDCRLAEQIVTTGNPAPRLEWAASQIQFCGEEAVGTLIPEMIRTLAHGTDPDDPRFSVYSKGRFLHDGRIFDALMDVAGDRSALREARVYAFEMLLTIRSPIRRPAEGFRSGLDPETGFPLEACSGRPAGGRPVAFEEGAVPLPLDFEERIKALARRVYDDETEHDVVRGAAFCAA